MNKSFLLLYILILGFISSSYISDVSSTRVTKDIYTAGYELNGTNNVAKYWNDSVATNLADGTNYAYAVATSIVVVGTDVYVAGYETNASNKNIAKYRKNGVATNLSDGTKQSFAYSIVDSGSDVYVVGDEDNGKYEIDKLCKTA